MTRDQAANAIQGRCDNPAVTLAAATAMGTAVTDDGQVLVVYSPRDGYAVETMDQVVPR